VILLAAGAAVVAVLLVARVAWALVQEAKQDRAVSAHWRDTHHRHDGRDDG
jgi:hypothetical protein